MRQVPLTKHQRTVLRFHVDNQAMAAVIRSGKNPTMRHLSRSHGISISWLHEQCAQEHIQVEYVTTTLMAADIYTKAFQDAVKWINLCEQINIVEPADLAKPHIHALHALLLTTSSPVNGKKIYENTSLMPDELHDWAHGQAWHEGENLCYNVVREPRLYRTCGDTKYTKRSTWLKHSEGWRKVENKVLWQSLTNPRQNIDEWVDRGVFLFEVGPTQAAMSNLLACLDDKVIDMPHCNVSGWHSMIHNKGHIRNDGVSDLCDIASSCCDMVNIKWSADDE